MRRFLWLFFLVIDGLFLSSFLLGFLARWIDPRIFWWPQILAIALPFTSIAIVALCGIMVAAKRKNLAILHACCVFLVLIRFVSFPAKSPSTPLEEEAPSLHIVTYNLGKLQTETQVDLGNTLDRILSNLDPDVVALQEFLVRYRGTPLRFRNLPYVAAVFDSLGYQLVASEQHRVENSFKPILARHEEVELVLKERISINEEGEGGSGCHSKCYPVARAACSDL